MDFINSLLDAVLDAFKDCGIMLPFMYGAYLVIGLIERGAGRRMVSCVLAADKVGPLAGGLLGVVPSCGFSAAASNLFGAGLLTTGTLLAVFLSTSDEMIAVMVSERADMLFMLRVLGIKALSGMICGFACDGAARLYWHIRQRREDKKEALLGDISDSSVDAGDESSGDSTGPAIDAAKESCQCGDSCCAAGGNLFLGALGRTLRVVLFVFAISVVLNMVFHYADMEKISGALNAVPFLSNMVAALLGLVPNCAVSVALTQLYLDGLISASAMLCGLLTGAGSGLLVLFRSNRNMKENLVLIGLLYVSGVLMGTIAGFLL